MNIPREAQLRGCAKGKATQRAQYAKRVQARLERELKASNSQIPVSVLLPAALRIYRHAYNLGWHVAWMKYRRDPSSRVTGRLIEKKETR
jgi:hypothetical protein